MGPNRDDYPNRGAYDKANRAFAARLSGLEPEEKIDVKGLIQQQTATIKALTERLVRLENEMSKTLTVTIEGRGSFEIAQLDHLRITLAAIVASRGQSVDLPLVSGDVIENIRIGELSKIAQQLFEQEEAGHDRTGTSD